MSLTKQFGQSAKPKPNGKTGKKKRPSPFCIRLSASERSRLESEAAGAALGAYIKAKALGEPPLRMRRTGQSVADRQALAQVLAQLGRSRLANNLNQLARAANIGSLPMTPETEAELFHALQDVREIRQLLMSALGLKPGGAK